MFEHTYDPQKPDKENLLGEWVCVEATTAGQADPELVGKAIEFRSELVLMKARPKNDEGVQTGWKLDTEAQPPRLIMNAAPVRSSIAQYWTESYKREGGALILCSRENS